MDAASRSRQIGVGAAMREVNNSAVPDAGRDRAGRSNICSPDVATKEAIALHRENLRWRAGADTNLAARER